MRWLLCAVVILCGWGCGHRRSHIAAMPPAATPNVPAVPDSSTPETAPAAPEPKVSRAHRPPKGPAVATVDEETGLASWYGHPYHGRHAANGEIYDMETMVAAHRTLPFDTRVRVENLDNGLSTEVRIIDRGPFVSGRIIDLSHAAAQEIQLIGPGVAHVKLHLLTEPVETTPAVFAVQVGAFADRANAERLEAVMRERFGAAHIVRRDGVPVLWRVLAGSAPTPAAAEILRAGLDRQTFVVRIDGPSGN